MSSLAETLGLRVELVLSGDLHDEGTVRFLSSKTVSDFFTFDDDRDNLYALLLVPVVRSKDFLDEFELEAEDVVSTLAVVQDDAAHGFLSRVELVLVEDRLEMAVARVLPAASLRNNDCLGTFEVLTQVRTGPFEDENLLFVDHWLIH